MRDFRTPEKYEHSNDIFAHDTPDFIHNYRIVHDKDSNKVIEGLHFTFIELPKFTPHSITDKRMMVLWLRFLTEINSNTKEIPADLLNDPEIGKAVEDLEVSGFTDAELRAYDKFWDSVSVERTLMDDRYQKGSAPSDRMAIVGRLSHHHLFLHKKWEKSNKIA